jgi:hypothetical protein
VNPQVCRGGYFTGERENYTLEKISMKRIFGSENFPSVVK